MSGDAAKLSPGEIAHTVFLCHRKAAVVAGDEPGGMHTQSAHTHTHTAASATPAFYCFVVKLKIINKNKTFGVNVRPDTGECGGALSREGSDKRE